MLGVEEGVVWMVAVLAVAGYLALLVLVTRTSVKEWRRLRGAGISARIGGPAGSGSAGPASDHSGRDARRQGKVPTAFVPADQTQIVTVASRPAGNVGARESGTTEQTRGAA